MLYASIERVFDDIDGIEITSFEVSNSYQALRTEKDNEYKLFVKQVWPVLSRMILQTNDVIQLKGEERLQILSTIQSIEDQIQTLQSTENEESQAEQLKSLQEELHTYQEMDTTLMNECENQKVILKNGEDHYLSSIEV